MALQEDIKSIPQIRDSLTLGSWHVRQAAILDHFESRYNWPDLEALRGSFPA